MCFLITVRPCIVRYIWVCLFVFLYLLLLLLSYLSFCLFVYPIHIFNHPSFLLPPKTSSPPLIRQSMQYVSMKVLYKTTWGIFIGSYLFVEYLPELKWFSCFITRIISWCGVFSFLSGSFSFGTFLFYSPQCWCLASLSQWLVNATGFYMHCCWRGGFNLMNCTVCVCVYVEWVQVWLCCPIYVSM